MLTTLPFSGFYNSKWSDELDDVKNQFIEKEADDGGWSWYECEVSQA